MDKTPEQTGGIYIHVPFCVKKCVYCDFYSCTDQEKVPEYVDSLVTEMHMAPDFPVRFDTVYFGGGTPSLLNPEHIQLLIRTAVSRFQISPDAEVTIEANPGVVSPEKLAGFRQAGVNRINIGVQSFSGPNLEFLSRIHTADEAFQAVDLARSAGFENIGLDLIYGLPGQTGRMWQSDLDAAIRLRPEHLSCYMLTYEPGTQMEKHLRIGRFRKLPDKNVGQLFGFTIQYLEDQGYSQYEVSNFSTSPQTRSRHNQKYWTHAPYIGLGPSAHSLIAKCRLWNVRSLEEYLRLIGQGQSPVEETEELSVSQLMLETLYLRLRCVDGILIPDFEQRFHVDFNRRFGSIVSACKSEGYLKLADNQCRLTRKGMLFADSIASRFIDAI